MKNVASQVVGEPIHRPPPSHLVDAKRLLERVWPDERSRPSVRWLRHQQRVRSVPLIRAGRRVLFCKAHVLAFVQNRLTVLAVPQPKSGRGVPSLPAPEFLTNAAGLTDYLGRELGLKRSVRWVRQQQKDRALPYVRWGGKVFFCPAQILATLLGKSNQPVSPR
jgi:hypothetical protein